MNARFMSRRELDGKLYNLCIYIWTKEYKVITGLTVVLFCSLVLEDCSISQNHYHETMVISLRRHPIGQHLVVRILTTLWHGSNYLRISVLFLGKCYNYSLTTKDANYISCTLITYYHSLVHYLYWLFFKCLHYYYITLYLHS